MTDAASSNAMHPALAGWFEAWRASTEQVISASTGKPDSWRTEFAPLAGADSDLHYTIAAAGIVTGEMSLRLSELAALRLAREFVGAGEAAVGDENTGSEKIAEEKIAEEDREALEELVRQIGGRVATAVGELLGGSAQLQVSVGEAPWARTSDCVATMWRGTESETGVEISLSAELAAAVKSRAEKRTAAASGSASASTASNSGAESLAGADASGTSADDGKAAGYRRLLDVGLGVKLRFGTRRMVLREVLALSTGSVVELDNKLNSPVDLLLDGRVIARGEVVVIDDKYGFRVTEVIDSSPDGASAQA